MTPHRTDREQEWLCHFQGARRISVEGNDEVLASGWCWEQS